jgi:hypothetical protein
MAKRQVGLVLFWLAVICAFAWGIVGSVVQGELFLQVLTFDELSQTIWRYGGPLATTWGLSVPLAALIAAIGVLLYTRATKGTTWKLGLGVFVGFFVSGVVSTVGHHSWLYALMGTLILLFFFGILLSWAKERPRLEGNAAIGADLKLAGYVFLILGIWFTCGVVGWFYSKALLSEPYPVDPINLMIYYALGLGCLFLGQRKTAQG